MVMELNVSENKVYAVECEACGGVAGVGDDYEQTIEDAKRLGFKAVQTEEDGVINYCAVCYEELAAKPLNMVLHCPNCGMQHVDAPEPDKCGCGHARQVHKLGDGCCLWAEVIPHRDGGCDCLGFATAWANPPHKSHLCHGCGTVWRPADVPTNGVEAIETRGENDTWPEVRF